MLYMYKICHERDGNVCADWFERPAENACTRQHADPLNVRPLFGRLEIRRHFFSHRAGEHWNAVPGIIKHARTAAIFKRQYSKYRDEMI
jgi:hypothetical protein